MGDTVPMMASLTIEQLMHDYDKQGCLHEQFIKQAKKTPHAIAVVTHDGQKTTYAELDHMTDILATKLRHLGVKKNTVVGILMERCLEYAVSYIAILKAGGAYMPLEISYPPSLLQSVLEDAYPVAVCSKLPFSERLSVSITAVVHLNAGWLEEFNKLPTFEEPVQVSLDDMAYTVYSSGTTGKPKGIQCPHRGAVFSYYWRHLAYPYGENEREACNIFFVWEMLRPLMKGTTMYIIPDDVIYDPSRLVKFMQHNQITRMMFTPSLLQAVLDFKGLNLAEAFKHMRQLWFCGEVVTTILRNRFVQLFPHIQLLNLYSISECHDVSCADLSQGKLSSQPRKFCPVGKLLPGVHIIVMDDDRNPKPVGGKGEIFVGGPALAIGYLNQPEMNAYRFIKRPEHVTASVGDRLYRTGDWGYVLSDGNLEICGRCDSTVKIRGYTIETQAIEAALLELPMVNSGAVLVKGEEGSDKFLVAYIVPGGKTSPKQIREALKKRLPFYMIPSKFIFIESVPILEASGKLNIKALPEDNVDNVVDEDGLPSTSMERKLAAIWCKILKHNAIDVHENFFDLGGHSLLATQLISEINSQLGLHFTSVDLFQNSTVSSMANYIENPTSNVVTLDLISEVERHKLTSPLLDISLQAYWHSMELAASRHRQEKILLTGVTGFVGSFLLKELLIKTQAMVLCLVRENPEHSAFDRIYQSLQKFGTVSSVIYKMLQDRVIALTGDISLVNLGLSETDYTYLSTEVDSIIHAAAYVNLIYPYHALYASNVIGTQNIIEFSKEKKVKSLHYISTDAVFPQGSKDCKEDGNMTDYAKRLTNGYAQTKWVAEQLVIHAQQIGLPAAIYRCGNVGGSREEASWNPDDSNLLMLQGCLHTLTAPDIDWQIELTPVDFVTKLLVGLTQDHTLSIGNIFNIVNSSTMPCKHLWNLLQREGYRLQVVPYSEWYQNIKSAAVNNRPLVNLLYLLDNLMKGPDFFCAFSTFTQENLLNVLEGLKLIYPPFDDLLVNVYVKHLASIGVIPQPTSCQNHERTHELQGKVVIVTGASSGIGAAIAQKLASAGAKVALAARRTDRLQDLKSQIHDEGGVAITVQMDVCDEKQVHQAVKEIESNLGVVNILVNNAGVLYYTLMKNLHLEEWNHMVDVNVKGVLNCTAAVLGSMVQRNQGHIVNISSDGGRRGFPGLSVYCGTKYFIEGMSSSMRQELVEHGIKVTCIQPGDVKTELFQKTTDAEAREKYEMINKMKVLEPKDVANAVLYAVTQPQYCAVNEVLVEPRDAPT